MKARRLDVELVDRGLVESRSLAQRLVMAGQVRVNGQVKLKASTKIHPSAVIEIDPGPKFVSRGGEKLEPALLAFQILVTDRICADVGASTGGFTDCLLQNGAERVYAIDVGTGLLDWKLRNDPRVVVMEKTNARYLSSLSEQVSLATIDVSFISLKLLLPVVKTWLKPDGDLIALIKPQFEAGRKEVSRGKGVIKDREVHTRILDEILAFAGTLDLGARGLICSPIRGPKGNIEFLSHFRTGRISKLEIENLVRDVIDEIDA